MKKQSRQRRENILVIGTGGHARVLISLLEATRQYAIKGLLDPKPAVKPETIFNYPVLGSWNDLEKWRTKGLQYAAVAVGNNKERLDIFKALRLCGFAIPVLIHPSATVDSHARLGEGSQICMRAVIGAGAEIQEGSIINTASLIDHETRIGPFAHVAPGCVIAGRVSVGEGVMIGIGTCVIDHIQIGGWATIGAGAVVISDIPAKVTAYGIPARIAGSV
jgi:sugar O-acyltransferase (sialic acid O-acetyltransferase NeuD family)